MSFLGAVRVEFNIGLDFPFNFIAHAYITQQTFIAPFPLKNPIKSSKSFVIARALLICPVVGAVTVKRSSQIHFPVVAIVLVVILGIIRKPVFPKDRLIENGKRNSVVLFLQEISAVMNDKTQYQKEHLNDWAKNCFHLFNENYYSMSSSHLWT